MLEFIIFLLVVICVVIILQYNSLIRTKNQVDNAFGSIDVMLKNRYDLIPSLVEIVKVYMQHEKSLLQEITELRTQFLSNDSSDDKVQLEQKIRNTMERIHVSVENYPELKAGENFIQLQQVWNETEEKISAARRFFNTAVTEYNNKIEQFPSNIIAGWMNLKRKMIFSIPDTERQSLKQ
jgi:LemA protein